MAGRDLTFAPAVATMSLIATGTPCSGPSGAPDMTARSARRAAARADSSVTVT